MTYGFVVEGNPHDVLPVPLPLLEKAGGASSTKGVPRRDLEPAVEPQALRSARLALLEAAGWPDDEAIGTVSAGLLRLRPLRVRGGEDAGDGWQRGGGGDAGARGEGGGKKGGKGSAAEGRRESERTGQEAKAGKEGELQEWAKERTVLWAAAVSAFALPPRLALEMEAAVRATSSAADNSAGDGHSGSTSGTPSWLSICKELRRALGVAVGASGGESEGSVGRASRGADQERAEEALRSLHSFASRAAQRCSRAGSGANTGAGGALRTGVAASCEVYVGGQKDIAATVAQLCKDAKERIRKIEF